MRVAIVTDIHANLPALDAALAAVEAIGVEGLYCGGDLVGYGPHPNEVCDRLRERGIPTIYGNYDDAIGRDLEDCGCAYVTAHDRELGQRSVDWTLANTGETSKAYMRTLPFDLRFSMVERRVRLVHGSPRKVNEYLFEDKPASLYQRLAAQADCDVLVFGHTPASRGSASTAACSSSTAARSESRRTAIPARPSPCWSSSGIAWRRRSSASRTTRTRSRWRWRRRGCRPSTRTR